MRYRVILLLVVAFTAFSSAMKELNQLQQFALDTSHLIAQLSDKFAPISVPPTPELPHLAVRGETCDVKQSIPAVELPWLVEQEKKPSAVVPRPSQLIEVTKVQKPVNRATLTGVEIAKLKKLHQLDVKNLPKIDVDPVAFEFRIPSDSDFDADAVNTPEFSMTFKAKNRRHGVKINPRDREMLLKTLNRSINLRIAS